jgi:hypothetical protein
LAAAVEEERAVRHSREVAVLVEAAAGEVLAVRHSREVAVLVGAVRVERGRCWGYQW